MNIGDKVRLIHGREEGIITKLLKNNLIEVEIEEGFKIPVQRNEIALISPDEAKQFRTPAARGIEPQPVKSISNNIIANQGIYMAFVAMNDRELAQHLINNSDWDIPFMFSVGTDPHHQGLASGVLKARTTHKVQDLLVKDFENWGTFTFQGFYFRLAFMNLRNPLLKKIKFRANSFFSNKAKIPLLGKEGQLFQIDDEPIAAIKIEPAKIVEKMFENTSVQSAISIAKPSATVDLHIEKLAPDHATLSNTRMLEIQMITFQQKFEAAIVTNFIIGANFTRIFKIHHIGHPRTTTLANTNAQA